MSGGIAIWNASNAVIEEQLHRGLRLRHPLLPDRRQPHHPRQRIWANNIHPDTLNWGFGIACNGNNAPILTENLIREHWYGVAAINGGQPNLGDLVNDFPGDDGGNSSGEERAGRADLRLLQQHAAAQMAQGNTGVPGRRRRRSRTPSSTRTTIPPSGP